MKDDSDLDLYQPEPPADAPVAPPPSGSSLWAPIIAVVVLVVGGGLYWYLRPRPASSTTFVSAPAGQPGRSDGAQASARREPVESTLPPLDESDAAVRDITGRLSGHPLVTAWLTGDNLLRNAAAVLSAVAEGRNPAGLVRRLAPSQPFRVRQDGGRVVMDSAGYSRYDRVAEALESVDAQAVAGAYRTAKPRLDEAFRELGIAGTGVDGATGSAIAQILSAPVLEGPIALQSKGIVYAYADPRLEALPPVQKLLVRMGPSNTKRIQARVREFARAAGLPTEPSATQP